MFQHFHGKSFDSINSRNPRYLTDSYPIEPRDTNDKIMSINDGMNWMSWNAVCGEC